MTLAEYTIRQIVRASAWRALRRAPLWLVIPILAAALLLGGCEEAQHKAESDSVEEINRRLPAGCVFKYLGDFSYVGRVSFVHCRDRPTSTSLTSYGCGKGCTRTMVTVWEEP